MSDFHNDQSANVASNGRRGVLLLTIVNLLAGLGSVYFAADLILSRHIDSLIIGLFGLVFTTSLGVSGLALSVRKKSSWFVALTAQIIAAVCPLIAAVIGIYDAITASGDFAHARALGGFLIFLFATTLAMTCLVGVFYIAKPMVRSLFNN